MKLSKSPECQVIFCLRQMNGIYLTFFAFLFHNLTYHNAMKNDSILFTGIVYCVMLAIFFSKGVLTGMKLYHLLIRKYIQGVDMC